MLIDAADIDNIEKFERDTINELDYIQPDFMMFKKNKYLHNERETKIAGCPDLLIEVWSDGNSAAERDFKLNLYSTSPVTEHWYIEQDSNEIICWLGKNRIENKYLTDVLVTLDGIEFDLRYLAI
jgi:Uma2 family endonuclease